MAFPGSWIQCRCGLRQGAPFSPYLFIIVADVLQILIASAFQTNILCHPLRPNEPPVTLQYADDTLIFVRNSEQEIVNLKFLLMCFEAMLGLKINFDKSEAFVTGGDLESQLRAAHMMNCELGSIPFKYLGIPFSDRALSMVDFEPMVDKAAKRVEPWQGKLLASGGRLVLINDCLTNIPMFVMGFYLLHYGTHEKLDKI